MNMPQVIWNHYLTLYYAIYSVVSVALVFALLHILHQAGAPFLHDSYDSNPTLARAIRRLLDIGYFLVCAGYFTFTIQTAFPMDHISELTQILTIKLGVFLLLLGVLHVFNLLLLALFRRPKSAQIAAS
jgi:hypothetical protein